MMKLSSLIVCFTFLASVYSCSYSGYDITLSNYFNAQVLSKSLLSSCPKDATTIDLSDNSFTTVQSDTFEDFYDLATIILTNNKLTEIPVGLFDQAFKSSLQEVYVNQNRLKDLKNNVFETNENLEKIDVAENNINFIGTNVFHKDLTKLKLVNISYNLMTYFEPWPYVPETPQGDRIDLEFDMRHNVIERFTNTMNWTYDLIQPYEYLVYLQYNKISVWSNNIIFQYRENLQDQSVLTELLTYNVNITNNPYFCDCKFYDLVRDLHESFFLYYRIEEFRYRCSSPSHLAGIDLLHDLDLDQFICNVTNECPSNCICQEQPYISTLVINCSNANLYEMPRIIPERSSNIEFVSLFLDGNSITEITLRNYSNIIKNLSVSNNNINYIDGKAITEMDKLENIDISGNELKFLPKEIQKLSFEKVSIGGNPLECSCDMIWMADWISLSRRAKDTGISCLFEGESKVIKEVTESNLNCNIEDFLIIFGIITGVVVAIIIAAIVTAKRCPYETKVLVYRFFRIHPRDRYEVDFADSMYYDAYLSYDGEDIQVRQWIKTIFLKKLEEKNKKYSFFCPQRDALVGEDYGSDLVNKMMRSRRIFILLSPGYFKNTWRQFESDQAEMEHNANEKKHPRVIYITWNEKNEEIKKYLEEEPWKSRLIRKRVLSPDERFFWSKVRYEMPIKPKTKVFPIAPGFANINGAVGNDAHEMRVHVIDLF